MILEGVILGGITFAGFSIMYERCPQPVKQMIMKHPLITDAVMVVFFYEVMGMTIIAHVAVAVLSLAWIAKMEVARNPDEYKYLLNQMVKVKGLLREAMDKLKDGPNQIAK